jgi:hypothetical protein
LQPQPHPALRLSHLSQGDWFEFYYSALQPGVHYVPADGAAAIPAAVEALQLDQPRAQAVADRGFRFATEALAMERVWAYWRALVERYAALQRLPRGVVRHGSAVSFADSIACPGASQCTHAVRKFRCPARQEAPLRQALEHSRKRHGEGHAYTATVRSDLADVLERVGKGAEAARVRAGEVAKADEADDMM